jgi:type II secretory pathway pseudopilin PulG
MRSSKGFSLVELAVAFTIIVLLLAGAMIPLSTQMELRAIADTQRSMESIREAIIGFAQANGRLPCPAAGGIAAGGAGAGTEQFNAGTGVCNPVFGVIPWATLGVAETDFWGRRFSYGVSPIFVDAPPAPNTWATTNPPSPQTQTQPCVPVPLPTNPMTFALCSLGDIAVFTRGDATTTAAALGVALPAVIISHGKNGFGAWQTSGIQRQPVPPVGTDENANVLGNTQAIPQPAPPGYTSRAFWSRTPTRPAAGCADPIPGAPLNTAPACEFDDIVLTISSNALIARMVAAGRLP